MTEMLVGVAVACVVAAAVGGGLKMTAIEIPALTSTRRQVLLGIIGIAIGVLGFSIDDGTEGTGTGDTAVAADNGTGNTSGTRPDFVTPEDAQKAIEAMRGDPTISLSRSSGPPGTDFTVSGRGFEPNERVEVRFHTTVLGEVRADSRGDFEDFDTEVPATPFRNTQRSVVAAGQSSIRTATRPFNIT